MLALLTDRKLDRVGLAERTCSKFPVQEYPSPMQPVLHSHFTSETHTNRLNPKSPLLVFTASHISHHDFYLSLYSRMCPTSHSGYCGCHSPQSPHVQSHIQGQRSSWDMLPLLCQASLLRTNYNQPAGQTQKKRHPIIFRQSELMVWWPNITALL